MRFFLVFEKDDLMIVWDCMDEKVARVASALVKCKMRLTRGQLVRDCAFVTGWLATFRWEQRRSVCLLEWADVQKADANCLQTTTMFDWLKEPRLVERALFRKLVIPIKMQSVQYHARTHKVHILNPINNGNPTKSNQSKI